MGKETQVDRQMYEPGRNELFAKAARKLGEAETMIGRRGSAQTLANAYNALDTLLQSHQAMLMLLVQIERMVDNAVRNAIRPEKRP